MALEVAWDLGPLILWVVALGLAYLALLIVKAITAPIGWLPVIGDSSQAALQAALVDPLQSLVSGAEGKITAGASKLLDDLAVLLAIPLLLGYGIYEGLKALWNTAIPSFVGAVTKPIDKLAHKVETLAGTAEKDAAKALAKVDAIVVPDAAHIWKAVETHVSTAVNIGVADAEKYADQAVAKLRTAEDAAIATATSLAQTAETDAGQAYTEAVAYAEALVAPVGADLSQLEQYVKGLGLAGLVAAVPALAALLTQVLSEAGLDTSACRAKNKQICGANADNWTGLLAGLAVAGIAFDLRQIVDACNTLGDEVVTLVKQAA